MSDLGVSAPDAFGNSFPDAIPQVNASQLLFDPSQIASYQQRFVKTWTTVAEALRAANVPLDRASSVLQIDAANVQAGKAPMSMDEAVTAISRVIQQHPITQSPQPGGIGGLLHNAVSDITGFAKGIIGLPGAIVHDISQFQLPTLAGGASGAAAGAAVGTAVAPGVGTVVGGILGGIGGLLAGSEVAPPGHPGEEQVKKIVSAPGVAGKIEAAQEAPLIRMIPGVTTAAAAARGQLGQQLYQHPLLTGVDVLPAAEGAGLVDLAGGAVGRSAAALRDAGVPVPSLRDIVEPDVQVGVKTSVVPADLRPISAEAELPAAAGPKVRLRPPLSAAYSVQKGGIADLLGHVQEAANLPLGELRTAEPIVGDLTVQRGILDTAGRLADKAGLGPLARKASEMRSQTQRALNQATRTISEKVGAIFGSDLHPDDLIDLADTMQRMPPGAEADMEPTTRAVFGRLKDATLELTKQLRDQGTLVSHGGEDYLASDPSVQRLLGLERLTQQTTEKTIPSLHDDAATAQGKADAIHDKIMSDARLTNQRVAAITDPLSQLVDRIGALRSVSSTAEDVAGIRIPDDFTTRQREAIADTIDRLTRPAAKPWWADSRTLSADQQAQLLQLVPDAEAGALVRARQSLMAFNDVGAARDAINEALAELNRPTIRRVEGFDTWRDDLRALRGQLAEPSKGEQAAAQSLRFQWGRAERHAEEARTATTKAADLERRVAKAQEKLEGGWAKVLPARWTTLAQDHAMVGLISWAHDNGHIIGDPATVVDRMMQGYLGDVPKDVLKQYADEATQRIADLKAAGYDPLWMHHVPEGKLGQQVYHPTVLTTQHFEPTSMKDRAFFEEPYVHNPQLALHGVANELEKERLTTELLQRVHDQVGRPYAVVREEATRLYDRAIDRLMKHRPELTYEGAVQKVIRDHYVSFDPDTWVAARANPKAAPSLAAGDEELAGKTLIPKAFENTLERFVPKGERAIPGRRIYDKTLQAFRYAVLGFSPAYAIHTTVGGLVMLLADTGLSALRFDKLREAWEMAGSWKPFHDGGLLNVDPRQMPVDLGGAPGHASLNDIVADRAMAAHSKLYEGLTKPMRWGFAWHELIGNMYRSLAYLYGRDDAAAELAASMGPRWSAMDAAARENMLHDTGLQYAHKAFYDLDRATPVERQLVRNVMPFYSWAAHVMKFTLRYPFDHPLRAGIVGSFAQRELDDWKSGLPLSLFGLIPYGGKSGAGVQHYLDFGNIDPWRSVANYFTLGGLVQSLSPAVQVPLRVMGVNTAQAAARQNLTQHYDPNTGQLVADREPLLSSVVRAIVPQTRVIPFLQTENDRKFAERNPAESLRQTLMAFGVPQPVRSVNIDEKAVIDERSRIAAQRAALDAAVKPLRAGKTIREAMATPEWAAAKSWPGLAPTLSFYESLVR